MRPAKADYCSGAAVGRSGDAFGDHEGESIEKPTVLLGFFEGRTERAGGWGLGGLGLGGLGLTDRVIAVRWSFLHPAAAALPAVAGAAGSGAAANYDGKRGSPVVPKETCQFEQCWEVAERGT